MSYVALGDSYASGEGLPPYLPDGGPCRRSYRSYPALLSESGPPRFRAMRTVACSGATTGDVLAFQVSAVRESTETVTLTVGGNDAGFAPVVAACLHSTEPRLQTMLDHGFAGGADWRDRVRSEAADLVDFLGGPAAAPRGRSVPLVRVLSEVGRRAPDAEVLVTGYPRLLSGRPATGGHHVADDLPLVVAEDDAVWLTNQGVRLDASIATAVDRAAATGVRARFVGVADAFDGHGLGDAEPWVNGVVLASFASLVPDSSSFHLTAAGQTAFAGALAAVR